VTALKNESKMSKRTSRPSYPDRKISETFLAFAEPLLCPLPTASLEEQLNTALRLAFTVWNAVVFADVTGDGEHLARCRQLSGNDAELAQLLEELVTRKHVLFAGDERLIGAWKVSMTPNGFNVRAEARDPHTVSRGREPRR
jgi:hypothetical protein